MQVEGGVNPRTDEGARILDPGPLDSRDELHELRLPGISE